MCSYEVQTFDVFFFFPFTFALQRSSSQYAAFQSENVKKRLNRSGHRKRPGLQSSARAGVNSAGDVSAHAGTPPVHNMSKLSEMSNICISKLIITSIHLSSLPFCTVLADVSAASAYVNLRPPERLRFQLIRLPLDIWWRSQRQESYEVKKKFNVSIRILFFLLLLFWHQHVWGHFIRFYYYHHYVIMICNDNWVKNCFISDPEHQYINYRSIFFCLNWKHTNKGRL